MDKDYSELIEYLDKRFDNIDQKFEETAKQKDLNELKDEVRNLVNAIDKLTKSMEIYHDEYVALTAKVDKHEKWFQQVAEKLGLKLNY